MEKRSNRVRRDHEAGAGYRHHLSGPVGLTTMEETPEIKAEDPKAEPKKPPVRLPHLPLISMRTYAPSPFEVARVLGVNPAMIGSSVGPPSDRPAGG